MRSRAVNTTKEQDEYRAAILNRKYVKKERKPKERKKYLWPTDTMNQTEKNGYYIGNCVFWINEYMAGRRFG